MFTEASSSIALACKLFLSPYSFGCSRLLIFEPQHPPPRLEADLPAHGEGGVRLSGITLDRPDDEECGCLSGQIDRQNNALKRGCRGFHESRSRRCRLLGSRSVAGDSALCLILERSLLGIILL